jgi:hypothetical protein
MRFYIIQSWYAFLLYISFTFYKTIKYLRRIPWVIERPAEMPWELSCKWGFWAIVLR